MKTGSSNRAINEAIQVLVQKKLIDVLSINGVILDIPEKRRGQQKLYYRHSSAIITHVENEGIINEQRCTSSPPNANIAGDLRKKLTDLTQKMRITKETIQN